MGGGVKGLPGGSKGSPRGSPAISPLRRRPVPSPPTPGPRLTAAVALRVLGEAPHHRLHRLPQDGGRPGTGRRRRGGSLQPQGGRRRRQPQPQPQSQPRRGRRRSGGRQRRGGGRGRRWRGGGGGGGPGNAGPQGAERPHAGLQPLRPHRLHHRPGRAPPPSRCHSPPRAPNGRGEHLREGAGRRWELANSGREEAAGRRGGRRGKRQQASGKAEERGGGRDEEGSGQSELACGAWRGRGALALLTPIRSEGHCGGGA